MIWQSKGRDMRYIYTQDFNLPQSEDGISDLWLVKSINTNINVDGTQTITAMRYYPLYADINLENLATQ